MNKTVVIPCAGTGSRLGDLTRNYNKAMITLGPKPVISYIIEHFTKEDEIIILLGYKGDYVKQVVQAIYPDWNITFREVDIFEGPGSGLGYSLSKAMDLLQKPFIFWPNDTIVDNNINKMPNCNWVMVGPKKQDSANYRHVLLNKSDSATIIPKNSTGYNSSLPYTGICYIKDYENFWSMFSKNRELFINDGEVVGINNLDDLKTWKAENWIDTGNLEILKKAQAEYSAKMEEVILEKPDEAIWFVDNRVIKFHIDPKFISDRVERFSTFLSESQKKNGIKIPELLYYSKNVYVYKREPGIIASKVMDANKLKYLIYAFTETPITELSDEEALNIYLDFYRDKTLSRIKKFLDNTPDVKDGRCNINGLFCTPVVNLVNSIDWKKLSHNALFSEHYHGDFHLENILVQDDEYVMLDWRQNFGKSKIGDIYYDYAKMWHSLIVNHNMVKNNLFSVDDSNDMDIRIDIHRTLLDTQMEEELKEIINPKNLGQVKILTALVFLNIAACHVYPYSKFLFYLGKYMLNDASQTYFDLFV